jgi:hypothetical protein
MEFLAMLIAEHLFGRSDDIVPPDTNWLDQGWAGCRSDRSNRLPDPRMYRVDRPNFPLVQHPCKHCGVGCRPSCSEVAVPYVGLRPPQLAASFIWPSPQFRLWQTC